jgi:hypothetical protein
VGMVGLCPACHRVKHLGLARVRGQGGEARAHLCRVNGWTPEQADVYLEQAFGVWAWRSQRSWTLDLAGLGPYVSDPELQAIRGRAARPPR